MGDPISVIGNAIQVVQLSSSVFSYVRDVKDATAECRKLGLEVSSIRGVLETLQDTLREVNDSKDWAATVSSLQEHGNPIEGLESILKPLQYRLERAASAKGFKKYTKSLVWPLTSKATMETLQAVERQKVLLLIALDNEHVRLSAEIKKDAGHILRTVQAIHEDVQDVSIGVSKLQVYQEHESASRAFSWLSSLQHDAVLADILRSRQEGTGDWLLQNPTFKSWEDGEQSTLFCPGIPGAGKTVIASTVIQSLLDKYQHQRQDVAVAWFFCNFKARENQTTTAILCSLARQIAWNRQELRDSVVAMHSSRTSSSHLAAVHEEDCVEILHQSVKSFKRVFVIIDALDECSTNDDTWRELIGKIQHLNPHARLLVTSRPVEGIKRYFMEAPVVNIVAHETDLRAFIRAGLKKHEFQKHLKQDAKLGQLIEETLIQRAQGMFLLVRLHMETIRRKARYSKRALEGALELLPEKLDETYKEALERINSQDADEATLAKQVFAWITHAFQFFSPRMLQQAVAEMRGEDPFDEDCLIDIEFLMYVCGGLVTVDDASQIIRPVHYTASEFLELELPSIYPEGLTMVNFSCLHLTLRSGAYASVLSEFEMERIAVFYRTFYDEIEKANDESRSVRIDAYQARPFQGYALSHVHSWCQGRWGHTRMKRETDDSFVYRENYSTEFTRAHELLFGDSTGWSKDYINELKFAVFFNAEKDVAAILAMKSPAGPSEDTKARSLCYAALRGYNNIVASLLDTGMNGEAAYQVEQTFFLATNAYKEFNGKRNCLGCAIIGGQDSTIKLIVERLPGLIEKPVGDGVSAVSPLQFVELAQRWDPFALDESTLRLLDPKAR